MAITRKVSSGREITEARGDEDVFPCSLTSKVRHVGEVWDSTKGFPTPRRLTLFSESIPRRNRPFPWGCVFLQSGGGKIYNHFTSPTKEKPESLLKLPRRGHHRPNRAAAREVCRQE